MICKWCAAEMTRGDIKCRRCGKETPALSDCGGFYDLVPQAAPKAANMPERRTKRNSAPYGLLCLLLAAALAVSVVFCVRLSGQKRELEKKLEKLETRQEDQKPTGSFADLLPGKREEETEPDATGLTPLDEAEELTDAEPLENE